MAIERAEHAGTLFLAAAGNDGLNNDELPSYPANYPMDRVMLRGCWGKMVFFLGGGRGMGVS